MWQSCKLAAVAQNKSTTNVASSRHYSRNKLSSIADHHYICNTGHAGSDISAYIRNGNVAVATGYGRNSYVADLRNFSPNYAGSIIVSKTIIEKSSKKFVNVACKDRMWVKTDCSFIPMNCDGWASDHLPLHDTLEFAEVEFKLVQKEVKPDFQILSFKQDSGITDLWTEFPQGWARNVKGERK